MKSFDPKLNLKYLSIDAQNNMSKWPWNFVSTILYIGTDLFISEFPIQIIQTIHTWILFRLQDHHNSPIPKGSFT